MSQGDCSVSRKQPDDVTSSGMRSPRVRDVVYCRSATLPRRGNAGSARLNRAMTSVAQRRATCRVPPICVRYAVQRSIARDHVEALIAAGTAKVAVSRSEMSSWRLHGSCSSCRNDKCLFVRLDPCARDARAGTRGRIGHRRDARRLHGTSRLPLAKYDYARPSCTSRLR